MIMRFIRFGFMSGMPIGAVAVSSMFVLFACTTAGQPQGPTSPSGVVPTGWLTYSDVIYSFSVAYPDEFGIVPEPGAAPGGALKRVRFLDKQLLAGQFADLEPPRFTVEVFPLGQASSLTEWARAAGRLSQGATTTAMTLAGAREGLRIQLRQQMAPNEFYYFLADQRVYALTAFGQYSAEMFDSFRLIP